MRNFDYLKDIEELQDLYGFCSAAEDTQQTNYDVCALNGRRALEWIVKAIYTLKGIKIEPRTSLLEMMSSEPFTQFIGDDDKLMMAAHYVRKIGNKAAHDGGVKGGEAYFTLLNIYNVVGGIFPSESFVPTFLMFFLKGMKPVYLKDAAGGAQPNISQGVIKNTLVPIVSIALQQQFASKIEAIEHQKELIKQSIKEVETLFNSRMDYYFN